MTAYVIQPSMSRGELSPKLHARPDIDYWRSGLSRCRNFYTLRQGGVRRRPGTYFMGPTKYTELRTVIRPFVFSPLQAYALEIGDFYIRFFTEVGQVYNGAVPYEIETPWPASDVDDLQFTQSKDFVYVAHPKHPPRKLIRREELGRVDKADSQIG